MHRIDKLPTARGFKVPWFVTWQNGEPEFRVADRQKYIKAVREKRCWICGERLGSFMAFVVGPMCAINQISADPPSHLSCAEYAVRECPFLSNPDAKRRDDNMPEDCQEPAGVFIKRNPRVALIYVTKSYKPFYDRGGHLITMGEPTSMYWYSEGRPATREEILDSIESGCPILREAAEQDGPEAIAEYESRKAWLLGKIENL